MKKTIFAFLLIIPSVMLIYYFYSNDMLPSSNKEPFIVEGEVTLDGQGISVEAYTMAEGDFFPGDKVLAGMKFANTSGSDNSFWAGCSIQCPLGNWFDIPAYKVDLKKREKQTVDFSWIVPDENSLVSGPYLITMAVWSGEPGAEEDAKRLATVQRKDAFNIVKKHDYFAIFNQVIWEKSSHPLGSGQLEPENVIIEDNMLKLILPANTLNGGQLETVETEHLYGSYQARMKLPNAPSSITGFFLYAAPDYYHEVDIEIFNDSSGDVWFTTYADGIESNKYETNLGFDPTADFYEYRFDFYPNRVSFYIEGELIKSFYDGLTNQPMKLMVNSWFPRWLEQIEPKEDAVTLIDWINY